MALWRTPNRRGAIAAAVAVLSFAAQVQVSQTLAAEGQIELSLPIACEPSKTCFIQSYADHDPGPAAADFACGTAAYDGHKGTDFRVLSAAMAATGVAVIASADGVVKGFRDGMDDYLIPDNEHARVANRECGNGVVLDHGNGWETQYCHMKRGSVGVSKGQSVKRGDRLGDVGYSGLAEFAHVHLEVRKAGEVIDPFTAKGHSNACEKDPSSFKGLWTNEAAKAFPISAGEIIDAFFAAGVPTRDALEVNHVVAPPAPGASAVYFVSRTSNIRKSDVLRIKLTGPGGFKFETTQDPLPVNRPLHLAYGVAKTAKGSPLPVGPYTGIAELLRNGTVISTRESRFELKP